MNVTHITEAPGHMYGVVGKASGPLGWYFTIYQHQPNGEALIWKATLFDMHEDAIQAWSTWGSDHAWDVDTAIGNARCLLDETQ